MGTPNNIRSLPWQKLRLDPNNPRLPESVQSKDEATILKHLYDHEVLGELVLSMLRSGFFEHEPLIVELDRETPDSYMVLEGNRRLAALKIIHGRARELGICDLEDITSDYTPADLSRLEEIPCFVVSNRDLVTTYLGYRHIGGMKTWSAIAKARYLSREVKKAIEQGESKPFHAVARKVGSNSQGVRNAYFAFRILQQANEEQLAVQELQRDRFGVWFRSLNSPQIREYIGVTDPLTTDYNQMEKQLENIDFPKLNEVIQDLSGEAPVVSDSRQLTAYGKVLANSQALAVLRTTCRLDLAEDVVNRGTLERRIEDLTERLKLLEDELLDAEWSESLERICKSLSVRAKNVYRTIHEQRPDEE